MSGMFACWDQCNFFEARSSGPPEDSHGQLCASRTAAGGSSPGRRPSPRYALAGGHVPRRTGPLHVRLLREALTELRNDIDHMLEAGLMAGTPPAQVINQAAHSLTVYTLSLPHSLFLSLSPSPSLLLSLSSSSSLFLSLTSTLSSSLSLFLSRSSSLSPFPSLSSIFYRLLFLSLPLS